MAWNGEKGDQRIFVGIACMGPYPGSAAGDKELRDMLARMNELLRHEMESLGYTVTEDNEMMLVFE